MRQLLEITYDDQFDSEATPADDIEGTIYKFILPDYTKSSFAFDQLVEADSTGFRPLGEKIGSYTRPTATYLASLHPAKGKKGKAKAKANGQAVKPVDVELAEDSEDAVVYEMYKVSLCTSKLGRTKQATGDVEHTWLPGVSPPNETVHPALHRRGQLCPCESHLIKLSEDPPPKHHRKTRTPGSLSSCMKDEKGPAQACRRTTSSATSPATLSGVTPTKSDYDSVNSSSSPLINSKDTAVSPHSSCLVVSDIP